MTDLLVVAKLQKRCLGWVMLSHKNNSISGFFILGIPIEERKMTIRISRENKKAS